MAIARLPAPVTLVALLAAAMAATAAGAGSDNSTICDKVNCGKGNCSEVPGVIPLLTNSYKCTCDPGWSQPTTLLNYTVLPSAPCIIPNCTYSSACFTTLPSPPRGIPVTDPCAFVNCGQVGRCEKGDNGSSYQCRCQPGFDNFLNMTSLPCIGGGNCTFGADCAKLGLVNTSAAPAPAPIGN